MSTQAPNAGLNFDSLTAEQFINLIGIDTFNRTVALKHYNNSNTKSFEEWYDVLDKDGITLPMDEKGTVIKKERSSFIKGTEIEEDLEESKDPILEEGKTKKLKRNQNIKEETNP